VRTVLVAAGIGALMLAPATWATETLGHAASSTFPAGGPGSAGGGPGGGFGPRGRGGLNAFAPRAFAGPGAGAPGAPGARGAPPTGAGGPPAGGPGGPGGANGPRGFGFGGAGAPGGFGGDSSDLQAAIAYAKAHGGGTIGVQSQSSAASAILTSGASVAGLGGFSGRESAVSVSWLAQEVATGHLRWILGGASSQAGLPGDTRSGSTTAFAAVAKACTAVSLSTSSSSASSSASAASALGSLFGAGTSTSTLYDCQGHAAAIAAASAS
jgi:hypothetical protein